MDVTILQAQEGYILTDGRQYVKSVATAGDSSKWHEVPESEAPTTEETDTELEQAKSEKAAQIDAYDTSDAVNAFYYQGAQMWIAKADRVGLANSLAIEQRAGHENTTLWVGSNAIELPIPQALDMLDALELYAIECYNVTARHKAEVAELADVESVAAYDIAEGYPTKLSF